MTDVSDIKPPRLLIVEGDREARTMLELALAYAGDSYQVFSAPTGASALLQLGIVRPDLILLDITLGNGDGWDTLKRIRERSKVPIIVLSPTDAAEITIRSLERGADYCMKLPLSMVELRARVQALLRGEATAEKLGRRAQRSGR